MDPRASRVALIGRRLEHNENLGLAYLRASLRRAGAEVATHYVNDAFEMVRAIEAVLASAPDVVGLSLADGGSAMLVLAVGEALAQAGYRGHVTAGGQFATLAREWLLARYPWLDSVVRFAGERPIVAIVERVRGGESVHGVEGVTTRDGEGEPARVLDQLPMTLEPERDVLPEILGHPAAHIAASRGCLGRCQYCGPAALHTLERREGVRAGVASRALTDAGVGGVKRRAIDAVCDEMAGLWHERGVRYFYFVDEHLLPYEEHEALDYLRRWKAGLARRGVGAFGIGTMLRADRVTPSIADAFADLGLVRVFVGLELASAEEGRRFGRRAPGERELALLDDFARRGVVTVSNLMLVHPYSTPETIGAGIDLLDRVASGVFEATRMMVYHGTRLEKTMAEERRLTGNPFRYGYTFDDARVQRFSEIFTRLRAEAFYDYSIAFRTHDAFLALALARRIHPERVAHGVQGRLDAARRGVNRLYVGAYRQGLDLALSGGGFGETATLVRALRPRVRELERELDGIERELAAMGPTRGRPFAPMRAAAASVVSFVLAACGGETQSAAPPSHATPSQTIDTSAPKASDAGATGMGASDTGPSPEETSDAPVDSGPALAVCLPAERETVERDVRRIVAQSAACFSGAIVMSDPPSAEFVVSAAQICNVTGTAYSAAAEQALKDKGRSCTDEHGHPQRIAVDGQSQREAQNAASAIARCPSAGWAPNVLVVLDTKGRVVRVDGAKGTPYAKCIQKVLSGLKFPCLSSFEVCPEHVIIE
jgi:radical SAM superfamily enzyme YgiQ (UPF0313 family)